MVDGGRFRYWGQNQRFRLSSDEDTPAGPQWCEASAEYLAWADTLLAKLSRDPEPSKIAWAEWKVYTQYRTRYRKMEPDHRAKFNLDRHLCLHQAFLLIGDKLEDMEMTTGIPELEPPLPPGQLQRSNVRDADVEKNAIRTVPEISPPTVTPLWVPEISPAIMPKGGERPAQDPGEHKTQPEHTGIPFRGAETLFRRDDEQALSARVAALEQQLAETQREKVELKRQLDDVPGQLAERDRQLAEERQEAQQARAQAAEVQAKLERYEAKRERRQELANERLKRWREQNPERVREQNTRHVRAYRARKREQGS